MSFLLDTNICSAHMKRPAGLAHRFMQHQGRLHIAAVALAELYAGAYLAPHTAKLLASIRRLLDDVSILPFDEEPARVFGQLRGQLQGSGVTVNPVDLMIAATALAHDLTLVTHNTRHFERVPGLATVDWLTE